MIHIQDLYFRYPDSDFKLQIDSLEINSGKTAIIGPSGFGKTTLLNLISGIYVPQQGQVEIDGRVVSNLSDKQRREYRITHIGFVFQDFKLIEYLNVMDNILLPYRINNAIKKTESTIESLFHISNELQINDKLRKMPAKLSHGERQRVAIARALLNTPQIILADEPTGNLDPENKGRIKDILFRFATDFKSTLITVTHDHELLEGFDSVIDFRKFQQESAR